MQRIHMVDKERKAEPRQEQAARRLPSRSRLAAARWMTMGPTRPRPRVQPPPPSLMPTGPFHCRKGPCTFLCHGFFSIARGQLAGSRRAARWAGYDLVTDAGGDQAGHREMGASWAEDLSPSCHVAE